MVRWRRRQPPPPGSPGATSVLAASSTTQDAGTTDEPQRLHGTRPGDSTARPPWGLPVGHDWKETPVEPRSPWRAPDGEEVRQLMLNITCAIIVAILLAPLPM